MQESIGASSPFGVKKNILNKKEARYLMPDSCHTQLYIGCRNHTRPKQIHHQDQL